MISLARFVIVHRWWVLAAWLLLAVAGGYAAPKAISALTYDFGLPGQAGYEANQQIMRQFGSGGDNARSCWWSATGGSRSRRPRPYRSCRPWIRRHRGRG